MVEDPITMNLLFEQLGLDSSDEAIEAFIANHSPLPAEVKIFQAHYWNSAQAEFLETALKEDSEWAIVVDELNERLSV
ncbi:MAG: DUF2789 family protein [Porticoccaceae bacterium]|nr:DUF2789 domain-containing protein [Pseudomonadales bacterium]MCP5172227.1 DUF2789 domain-containing protein [Pseudomonadales bacterium]